MDFTDPRMLEIFFSIHSDLPREGPGSRESTAKALSLCGSLPDDARVLDLGCGPGQQTMDLAGLLPGATITAIDNHPPFVDETNRRATAKGVSGRVKAEVGDMTALDDAPASFDLIWCEGAAYIMGVEAALKAWMPLLKPAGRVALTEAVWLKSDPPADLRRVWDAEYPAMRDIPACRDLVASCGYRLLGDFVLPDSAWWDDYYTPKLARIETLRSTYAGDETALAVLDEAVEETLMHRTYSAYYGYVFLVMALTPSPSFG
ncbi:MAG: class I SAM-dependent methyltransferase [Pseudomonadota bacterium]